jgi:hypothetical protein
MSVNVHNGPANKAGIDSGKRFIFCVTILLLFVLSAGPKGIFAQNLKPIENYIRIDATANDPLYTTYAATIRRSKLYGDKAYHMDFYSPSHPIMYTSDHAGSLQTIWKIDDVVICNKGEFFAPPVVQFSFPDMAILTYQPMEGIVVKETFFVYHSSIATIEIEVFNTTREPHEIVIYPMLYLGNDSLQAISFDPSLQGYIAHRYESPYRLISSLKPRYGYPTKVRDLLTSHPEPDSYGAYQGNLEQFYETIKTDFYSPGRSDKLNHKTAGYYDFITLQLKERLRPGEQTVFRVFRGFQGQQDDQNALVGTINEFKTKYLKTFFENNLILFSRIPRIQFPSRDDKLIYLSAFNLVRGNMLAPTGKTHNNFYVFSRNPLWGWGHGHQVLHESISMIPYASMDGPSAMGSQRVYMEQQREDGLIAYRHGPRGLQDYPHKNMSTTSAPFYSWINREIYDVTHDRAFLEDAYQSGKQYMNWLIENRDTDLDSTYEWGPYGLIENVRDWYNAVFQVSAERYLDVDKEDISDELECLDLTLMMINEAQNLAYMARKLGLTEEEKSWKTFATVTSDLVNERMWDDSTGFYYSINKKDHGWYFMTRDLRRQEIIGFLPLWAEATTPERAAILVETLTDSTKFWRRYGIPTLSADDPWYDPNVDYCCKWNGPVWMLWNYMVYKGLKNYGYDSLAHELALKMVDAVSVQLKKNHRFWESYSPDNTVLNCPSNYIWDAIIAKVLIDEYKKP